MTFQEHGHEHEQDFAKIHIKEVPITTHRMLKKIAAIKGVYLNALMVKIANEYVTHWCIDNAILADSVRENSENLQEGKRIKEESSIKSLSEETSERLN